MHSDPPALSKPNVHSSDDHPAIVASNARSGLWLFGLYLLLYSGFVGLSAFAPDLMAGAPFGGLNLAVLYGMGLIAAALVLALVYVALCGRSAEQFRGRGDGR